MHTKEDDIQDHDFQIAPIVDVVFMLIIFFMLSAAVTAREHELGLTLPGPPGPIERIPIELAIRDDGTVLFNELEVGKPGDTRLAELQMRLKKAIELFGQGQPVIIEPAPSALHARIVEVVDCCASAQVKALSFAK